MSPHVERHEKSSESKHIPNQIDALSIFEATPNPYIILDPEFRIVAVNEAYLSATSTIRDKIIGRGIFEVFPDNPDDLNANGVSNLRASLERVLQTGKPHRMDIQKYDIPMPGDGFEERYWSPINTPVFDQENELQYIIHHVEDITEKVKKRIQTAELEESLTRFRQMANVMPQIVWTALPDGRTDYFNDRFYEFTGLQHGSTYDEEWINYVHPDDHEKIAEAWMAANESFSMFEVEYRIKDKSGDYRWILSRALSVRGNEGKIIRWFGTSTDIDDQKQTQAELNNSILDREIFFSIVSHELKSPLSFLSLQAQIFLRKLKKGGMSGMSEDVLRETMEKIYPQTGKLVRLVDDMLDFSRISAGKLTLDLKPCNLCILIEEVIERLGPQLREAGINIPEIEYCKGAQGLWDPLRIEQVITNLLTNAIRYGNGKPIIIKVSQRGGIAEFFVEDQGIGIPPEAQEKIFNRFERATSASKVQGLGLGLYITKQLVEAHHGNISVESTPGKGSCFYVELPVSPEA